MLWVDRHRPTTLERLDIHPALSERLQRLAASKDFPHLFFYGPSGSGKKTRVMALLRELYGPGVEKLKVEHKTFSPKALASSTQVEVNTISSAYHIEINPSDAAYHDRFVVQETIKEMAQNVPLDATGTKRFKVVVINEVDLVSREAQQALRRTMEKYIATCRIILLGQSFTRVIEPVRSRCLTIRVPAPTEQEIMSVLVHIGKREGIQVPPPFAASVAIASDRNLRRAILMLEASKVSQYPFVENQIIQQADWEIFVADLAHEILEEQSPKRLLAVRGKLYELLTNCIPAQMILQRLTEELMKKLDSELKHEVTQWAAFYEHRLQLGTKHIYHLEAFVARFMSLYKRFLIMTLG